MPGFSPSGLDTSRIQCSGLKAAADLLDVVLRAFLIEKFSRTRTCPLKIFGLLQNRSAQVVDEFGPSNISRRLYFVEFMARTTHPGDLIGHQTWLGVPSPLLEDVLRSLSQHRELLPYDGVARETPFRFLKAAVAKMNSIDGHDVLTASSPNGSQQILDLRAGCLPGHCAIRVIIEMNDCCHRPGTYNDLPDGSQTEAAGIGKENENSAQPPFDEIRVAGFISSPFPATRCIDEFRLHFIGSRVRSGHVRQRATSLRVGSWRRLGFQGFVPRDWADGVVSSPPRRAAPPRAGAPG
ncbi:hypothetical protein F4780DRAFT_184603 [Xylariomycetidae sp. FL0641]|nr:hypothetical protein F4780DRAFT_184603 [Xylariomycetidae sp. FL0641]